MKYSNKERGVSLIELITGIALIVILMALGAPSYIEWIENSRVRSTAESIQSGLQLARMEAVTRNTQVQLVIEDDLGWYVGCVVPDENDANLDGKDDCPEEIQRRSSGEVKAEAVTLTFIPADNAVAVFNGFGKVAPNPAPASFSEVEITTTALDAEDARNLRVLLGIGGITRMCDPALPATDPRAC